MRQVIIYPDHEDGGWTLDYGKLIDKPFFCEALPSMPLKPPYGLKHMVAELVVAELAEHIAASRFDRAAKLIDELADAVRAVRDSSRRRYVRQVRPPCASARIEA
jgi:hypothetical protein